MALKYIDQVEWTGKTVLARFDFNVPMKKGVITDSTRIDLALPTIQYLLSKGVSKLVMMSHLGRPTPGKFDPQFSLEAVATMLAEKLKQDVVLTASALDPGLKQLLKIPETKVVLLENLRFHAEEEKDDSEFARTLSSYGDYYVNDAFGAAHRNHASIHQIVHFYKDRAFGGLLLKKEVEAMSQLLERPKKPFVALMGGAKISDKIKTIDRLLVHVDQLLIGGAMAYPFLKAQGVSVGRSLCSEGDLDLAKKILQRPSAGKIHLPTDHIVSEKFEGGEAKACDKINIPEDMMGMDIGPRTRLEYARILQTAETIFWNGPMGLFEQKAFSEGTFAMAKAISETKAFSVVGGGDSVSAVNQTGLQDHFSHVSSGGGASLEYIEQGQLPGIQALKFGV